MILKPPLVFLTGLGLGAFACPFMAFFPGSASFPLLSTAIFYRMQLLKLLKGSLPARRGRRRVKTQLSNELTSSRTKESQRLILAGVL